ncbi:MAG TPA: hypothetical protein ACFCUD_13740 [Cyclobacteriaceae bacterium]
MEINIEDPFAQNFSLPLKKPINGYMADYNEKPVSSKYKMK